MAASKNIGADSRSNDIGLVDCIGGVVVLDQPFKRANGANGGLSCKIYVGVGLPTVITGTIVIEDADGQPIPYIGRPTGDVIVVKGARVLTSAVINGTTYTTDCTGLTWTGGVI